jgi:GTP-binding protein
VKPIVAVVGRPNVGKSTLFNKIAGRRIAIVEGTPGVTRDRIYTEAEWNGCHFTLIDTSGLEQASKDKLLSEMRAQAQIAIDAADVIVFVTDVRVGVTADDAEISTMLKHSGKPIIVVTNYADTIGEIPAQFYEFYDLGLGDPVLASAMHGKGVGDLLDKIVELLPNDAEKTEEEEDEVIKIAVVGKPNAGKSSLINKILGENRLIVSDTPGTTRDSIDTDVVNDDRRFLLIDTAGMRKRGKIEKNLEKYSVIRSLAAIERADVVLAMIDGTEGISEQDAKIAGYAHDNGKAVVITVNKWDIVEKDGKTQQEFKRSISKRLPFMLYAPVIFVSALTGHRMSQVFKMAEYVYRQSSLNVSTSALNEIIIESVARKQPPSDKGKRLKIYYATQVGIRPPTFALFVNNDKLMHFSYERYIENQIRQVFQFDGTRIKIVLKNR